MCPFGSDNDMFRALDMEGQPEGCHSEQGNFIESKLENVAVKSTRKVPPRARPG